MSKILAIKSYLRRYTVLFSDDYRAELRRQTQEKRCFFIVDRNIARVYSGSLKPFLKPGRSFILEAVESNKNLEMVKAFIQFLLKSDFKRGDRLMAVGGGIIQDICGFTSSILFRGVDWYFYPTTLLAQADSCIGSKNCINVGEYKNQLGTFCPPNAVILDTCFLKSLPQADIRSGLGEIIKFFILDSRESLDMIIKNYDSLFEDDHLMHRMVRRSLNIKKRIIEKDEFDQGIRNIFNYGHTFGHAIESITRYRISHGQAITIGMGLANYISLRLGYLKKRDYESMMPVIIKNSPPFRLSRGQEGHYLKSLSKDKKNTGKDLTCILLKGPGRALKVTLPFNSRLKLIIREYFSRGPN